MPLPPCGLYRTTRALAGVAEGRLVYFHNHGDPGPGLYLPERWQLNRAEFASSGHTLGPADDAARGLEALPAEGLYRVRESFFCCAKQCKQFEADLLVQLGYDGEARALLFVPEWTPQGLAIPERGTAIDGARMASLAALRVVQSGPPASGPGH